MVYVLRVWRVNKDENYKTNWGVKVLKVWKDEEIKSYGFNVLSADDWFVFLNKVKGKITTRDGKIINFPTKSKDGVFLAYEVYHFGFLRELYNLKKKEIEELKKQKKANSHKAFWLQSVFPNIRSKNGTRLVGYFGILPVYKKLVFRRRKQLSNKYLMEEY